MTSHAREIADGLPDGNVPSRNEPARDDRDILAYAKYEQPFSRLRNPVVSCIDNKLPKVRRLIQLAAARKRVKTVSRTPEIIHDQMQCGLPAKPCREQAWHVLHDEHGRSETVKNAEVLKIQRVPRICRKGRIVLSSGASGKGIRLTGTSTQRTE